MCILFFGTKQPPEGQGFLIIRGYTIIFRHHNLYESSGRVISPIQTSLPDNIRHSQQTDFYVQCGIRTRNPKKQAAAKPRLKPRGHRDTRRLIHYNIYQEEVPVTYSCP